MLGNDVATYGGQALIYAGNVATGKIGFYTANVERVTIANSGNVLIATSTDDGANKLQVNGTAKFAKTILKNGTANFTDYISTYEALAVDGVFDTGIADAVNNSVIKFTIIDMSLPRSSTFEWALSAFSGNAIWITNIKDNSGTVNLYIDSGTWKLQNKTAGTINIVIHIEKLSPA